MLPTNIEIGKEYGTLGIPIQELLSREPDDTIYSIGHHALSLLPKRYTKPLLENYRVMCVEIMEGGNFIFSHMSDKINQYKEDYNIRELQEVEIVIAPSLLTEGKVYQKAQQLGMGK